MKKKTHLLVAKHFSKDFDLSCFDRFWLCFGSIAPDLTPMCILYPHRFKLRNYNVLKRFSRLNLNSKNWLFYFKVGVISHFLADFFTAPHNRKGIKGFCTRHRSYESDLSEFFKCNLESIKFSSQRHFDFENYLDFLHSDYIKQDEALEIDFNYICRVVYYFLIGVCYDSAGSK